MKTGSYKERFLTIALWVTGLFAAVSLHAQAMEPAVDSLRADTSEVSDPEWYVAPDVREDYLRTPKRASANVCPLDSVCIFNIDSILVEVTVYEYGDTTRTVVWTVNPDGSRVGKSRTESASTATTSYSAAFTWDAATNDWKGTAKEEHTYNSANKEILRLLYNTWLNNAWVADTKYTWIYDAAGRETEYTTYTRNTSTNELVLSQQRIREYNAAGKITLEIQYTAHNGSDWSAGTKKEYDYDAAGNQIEYTYYSSLSNGNWIGSTHEVWTYTSGKKTYYEKQTWSNGWANTTKEIWKFNAAGKQTFHEKYNGSNSTWTLALQENLGYDEAGNNILIENYSLSNSVWTGTKKEVYTFNAAKKKTSTIIYKWTNGIWVENSKEVWAFNASNKQTLHEKYNWSNDDWAITLQENSGYDDAGNNTLIENYSISNGVWTGTKKEEYVFNYKKKTVTIKSKWSNGAWVYNTKAVTDVDAAGNSIETANYNWSNDTWVGTGTRTLKTYNSSKKVTEEITQNWPSGATDWVNKTCTTTVYSGANKTQEVYYTWANDTWEGVKRTDYHFNAAGLNDTTMTYAPDGIEWIQSTRVVNTYDTKDNLILAHGAGWNGSAWVLITMQKQDILYDANDNLVLVASWKCNADSIWYGVQKDTSAYLNGNPDKPLYRARFTSWANNEWIPSYRIEYEYDEAERTLLNQRFEWKSGMWKGIYRYEYEYSAQGKELMSAYYNGWSTATDSWVGSSKKETTYNNEGQTTSMTNYNWQNNDWHATNRYFYKYDANNRTIEQVVQNYTNDEWGNSLRFETLYKGSIVIKSNDYTWLNNAWQFTRRNEKVYDDDAQAKLRREITGSWNNSGVLSSFTDKLYFYACDPRFYTIRFVNHDGTVLSSLQIEEGQTPSYDGEEPVREANSEYTYAFAGWTPTIVPATANTTYTATFTATKRSYTITWLNEDGTEISHETLEYGAMPAHADMSKENTAEYTYTFAGWTPGIGIVTGDASYTATFDTTKNSYTITWLNDDLSQIDQTTVEYGVVPTHADPTKQATDAHSYAFAGWTPQVVAVTGNATYTATFTETTKTYTIYWLNEDGSEISHENLAYGATPAHADPSKEATPEYTYTFSGWTPQIATVTGDASYTATFTATKRSYTITWLNEDGSEISHETLEYGATPAHADIYKEKTAQYTYTFTGWTPQVEAVTGNAEYTATFTATKNSYTINWLNSDNSPLAQTTVAYGESPVYTGEKPSRPSTAEYTYTFAGWSPGIGIVTGDATYTATFTATKNKYLITFKDEDGSVLKSEELEYGVMPTAPSNPTKANTAEWSYTFNGWNKEVVPVKEAATYTATYNATKNSYTITFADEDGMVLQSSEVEYGAMPTAPSDPTKANTAEWSYTFSGWTPQVEAVTGNAEYTATYTATKKTYTITWKNEDGSVIESQTLEYGATPTHADITKESTAEYTYTFAGWTPAVATVTGDATYTATFTATERVENKTFTITFYYEDGVTVLDQVTVKYGETPSTSLIPSKYSEEHYYYTFSGWSPEVVPAEGNASYTATFTAVPQQYTVTFKNHNGRTLLTTETPYGEIPEYTGETPTRTKDKQYTYVFAGWSPELTEVTGPTTYTAVFDGTLNQYTVLFLDEDGTELDSQTLDYGTMPVYEGETPTKDDEGQYGYTFKGWSPKLTSVTKNATYRAVYTRYDKTQGIEDVQPPCMEAQKILIDNQIFIRRGGNIYTIDGQRVQ